MDNALNNLYTRNANIIVFGDFIFDHLTHNNRKFMLSSLLNSYNTVYFPITIEGDTISATDNFIDRGNTHTSQTNPLKNALSDHDAQLIKISYNMVKEGRLSKLKTRNRNPNHYNSS